MTFIATAAAFTELSTSTIKLVEYHRKAEIGARKKCDDITNNPIDFDIFCLLMTIKKFNHSWFILCFLLFLFSRQSLHLWMPFAMDFRFIQSDKEPGIETNIGACKVHIGALTPGDQRQHNERSTLSDSLWDQSASYSTARFRCT